MIGFRPLKTSCWEKLLTFLGYKLQRISASHHQWTKPQKRTIPVWGNEKEIPALHKKTSANSFGWSLKEVYAWAEENC